MRTPLLAIFVALAFAAHAEEALPPQVAVGGAADAAPATPPAGAFSEFPVASPGAEGMTAYLFLPDPLPAGRKVPLLFALHGNGDSGKGRHANLARVSTKDDPVIVVGIQYQKEVKFNAGLWDGKTTLAAFDWLLAKVMAEQPVDPDNVYAQGFSMGCGYAGSWAYQRFGADPKTFPFRALFFVGSPAPAGSKDAYPPVPYLAIVGEKETAVLGTINVVASVKTWANQLARIGRAVDYHEIPGMEHSVNARCHAIMREAIHHLRGPRDLPLAFEAGPLAEVATAVRRDRLGEAHSALGARIAAKETDAKSKTAARAAKKKLEDWSAVEMKRLDGVVGTALAQKQGFDVESFLRLVRLAEAFPDLGKKHKGPIAALAKKQADELRRRVDYIAARALEATDAPKAKAALEALAAAKTGRSAQAAAYRLGWWMD